MVRLCLLLGALCGLTSALLDELRSAESNCEQLVCPEGKECLMVRGRPYCVTQRSCKNFNCRYDQECKVIRGMPRCTKISTCDRVSCDADTECKVFGGVARCVKRPTCADLTCYHGETCVEEEEGGSAACVETRGCRDLPCPAGQECQEVAGRQRCVARRTCDEITCAPGQRCNMFSGRARCVTASSCADTRCRYDQRCEVYHNLAHCVPLEGVPCGSGRCQPGHSCVEDPALGVSTCSPQLSCDGVLCLEGQQCALENRLPRCVASCSSLQCPGQSYCVIKLDVAVCVECDLDCPWGQVCRLQQPTYESDLYLSVPKVPRCVSLYT